MPSSFYLREALQNHYYRAGGDEDTADERLHREGLVQEHECEHEGDHHAELIYRHDL